MKKKTENPIQDTSTTETNERQGNTTGWDAISAAFERLYPEQKNPKHYGTLISYRIGGSDSLDGISIYDGGDFWHFVTYGLSELYDKKTDDPTISGFGFEFTFKLKKVGPDDEEEICGACSILQELARYVFQTGSTIRPNEYIYTQQKSGIDVSEKSQLTGFVTASDDLLDAIETPNGKVQFITLIGATDAELRHIYENRLDNQGVTSLLSNLNSQITDYDRQSTI